MGGGKGGGSQTTVQKSDPWEEAKPYLLDVLGQSQAIYNQPSEYYPFSTWIPYSPQTEAGLQQLTDFALGPSGQALTGAATNAAFQALSGAGNSPALPWYAGVMDGAFNSAFNPTQTVNSNIMGMTAGANPVSSFLTPTADGSMMFNNPYLDRAFDMGSEKVRNAVNDQFSIAGRYGSGAHQDVMQQGMNDLATQLYGGAYESERGRQMQAAGAIQQGWEGDLARIMAGAQQYGQTEQQKIADMMGGAQGYQDAYSGGMLDLARVMAVAPQAYEFATAPGQTLMEVGGAYEQQAAQQLQDLMNRWMFEQEAPQNKLMNYSGIAASMGGMGGMTTQTSPFQGPSPFQQVLSGASAVTGLLSLFGLSGRPFKYVYGRVNNDELLERVSKVPGYEYHYHHDPAQSHRYGPMADEYAQQFGGSSAVIEIPPWMGLMWSTLVALTQEVRTMKAQLGRMR